MITILGLINFVTEYEAFGLHSPNTQQNNAGDLFCDERSLRLGITIIRCNPEKSFFSLRLKLNTPRPDSKLVCHDNSFVDFQTDVSVYRNCLCNFHTLNV